VLVPVDAPTDPILLPINSVLLGLGQVAIVRRHVPLLAVLHAGFALLQIAGFFRSQGAVLDAVGDAVLLVGFAAVYLIHAGMARIDDARSGTRSGCGLGDRGARKHQTSNCQDQEQVREFVDHIGVNPAE